MASSYTIFSYIVFGMVLSFNQISGRAELTAKDNGDIFVVNDGTTNYEGIINGNHEKADLDEVRSVCNASFSIPMGYLVQFNTTGELPNIIDKTAPCFIRCFYEKSGFIENWKLNKDKIRQYMWPATGDSIETCQEEGKDDTNVCLRAYSIAKCLMIRALVDARSVIQ